MTQAQYQLWLSTYNAGIKAGKTSAQAHADAIAAANAIEKFN